MVAALVPGYGGPTCKIDGAVSSCHMAFTLLAMGAAVRVSANAPSGVFITFTNRTNGQSTSVWSPLTAMDTPRGTWVGYVPMGAQFNVDGHWNIFEINLRQIAAPGSRNMTYVGMLRELPGNYAPPSRGGNPQYYWLQTPRISVDAKGIRENLVKVTTNPDSDCANFIKDLLNRVATPDNPLVAGGDLVKIFDLVMSQRGLSRGGPTGAGGSPTGYIGQGRAGIAFGISRMASSDTPQTYFARLLQGDSDIALHELIHLGLLNGVDDRALARALFPTLEDIPFPTNGTDAEKRSWVLHWSNIWDTELRKHCKRAPLGIPGMHVGPG